MTQEKSLEVSVAAVMTAGRYECTFTRNHIELALKSLGVPLMISGGVFYGQCMQKMLQELVNTDCQYAVTIDWDTCFKPEQLISLLHTASQREDIHAITGMQARRGMATTLATIQGKSSVVWDGDPIQVDTAHFGLTVIKLDALRKTQKPWFFSQPDENGEWNDKKIDCDIWFWKQWREAGNTVYIDPNVRIGHMEELVAVFDDEMKVKHVYPADWVDGK
jgi:hypothetical protein